MSGAEKASQGSASMSHVWEKSMSGKRRVAVLLDLESVVTRRYDRSDMAAAMAVWRC